MCELRGVPCDYGKCWRSTNRCCQTQTGGLKTTRELEPWASGVKKDKDSDMPTWMFEKKSNQKKAKKHAPQKRDSKKKQAQPKENDYLTRRSVEVKGGTT